jgi:hypothetical protein
VEHDGGLIKITDNGREYWYDKKVLSGLSLNDLRSYGLPEYTIRHIKKLRESAASLPDV